MSAATAQLNFQLCTFPNAVGCSNRSSSLMWLDWSFHQASHCWLHGTLGSSGSTQPHGSKGRLTLVTTAGTAQPSPAVPEQMPCAALCPCGKLDTGTSRAGSARCCSGVPGLLCWLWVWHHHPWDVLGGWIPLYAQDDPSDLSEGHSHPHWNYSLGYFPSHPDTSFPWRNEGTHSDRSLFPFLNWPSTASSAPLVCTHRR